MQQVLGFICLHFYSLTLLLIIIIFTYCYFYSPGADLTKCMIYLYSYNTIKLGLVIGLAAENLDKIFSSQLVSHKTYMRKSLFVPYIFSC